MTATKDMNLESLKIETGETAAAQVERDLREQIIKLELAPGTRLSEQEIATRMGVSRQPVREALIALGRSKLVDVRPNRGTVVVRISARQMMEARFVREALETAVARRASESFDSWTRRRIDTIIGKQRMAMEAHDHNAFRREDEQFHIAIAEGAGCSLAWSAIADIKAHMDRVCNLQLRHPDSMMRLITEHEAIITAIDGRDADAAVAAMRAHLNGILSDLPQIEADHPDLFE
ncbi:MULTISPECIES: GntR family transcriptional regulator [unclassified Rhizobium]|uniref:GntR family transcriptional regulator n=1 Tax=unclassified Rhizobium TaxID=2613769 RepID=UPI00036A4BC0|nr:MULTISPECIES: GntR family transcriptional regulator [unclassified Rhizobium]MBO9126754.1 GntR family transcriptional regulator [Rhizobium sp. 16-488-2b]MBO9177201.1 GntR family transcriptional regulator [Rhizobium sp. 16-488-2a]